MKIVVTFDRFAFLVACLDGSLKGEDLRKCRQALLPIKDKQFRIWRIASERHIFHGPHLEPRSSARFEEHYRADGEGSRNADQQTTNMLIVPNPASLKVG